MTAPPADFGQHEQQAPNPDRPRHVWRWPAGGVIILCILIVSWQQFGPEARFCQGKQALLDGDYDTVERVSEGLIRTSRYHFQGLLLKGLLLARTNRIHDAIRNLQDAAKQESLFVEAQTALAQCYYESNQYLQAIDAASIALDRDPTSIDARRWLAAAYYDLGAISQATTELERISEQALTDPRPERLLGLIAKDSEQFTKAISHYQKALARDPTQPDQNQLRIEMAESQIKTDQFEAAMTTLMPCNRSAVKLTLQARCEVSLGQTEQAESHLREAMTIDPVYVPAKLALGKMSLDGGKADTAVEILTTAVKADPFDRDVHFQLSQAYRVQGTTSEADRAMERMLEIQSMEQEFSRLHDQAASEIDNPEIRYQTGVLAERLGKRKLAEIWFRAALAIDPNHAKSSKALKRN